MSDVGLQADLLLDVRQALQAVERVNEALNRATTQIPVTADTRAVTAAIDAAIQNANAALAVVADTTDVTASITSAVENADAAVVVTGEASELTGEITAAVDAADTTVVVTGTAEITGDINAAVENADTSIEVEGNIQPGLTGGIEAIGDSLDAASESGAKLGTLLSGLGVAAIAKGLFELGQAASNLAESTSKASVVFGDSFDSIADFSAGAASSIGLSNQAALEATGTFGNLFQALGLTQTAAATLAPDVVTLAADLASFNNLEVDDALEKIRSGLVGEIEPLRSLGISFNAAQVDAKGLELGLADANGELSEGAKVQARWVLITEQSTLAAGDFARTSEGLANQQRSLTAELQNAAAEAGQALLPAFLDLVAIAREGLVPQLSEIGERVLPAFAEILVSLAPLLGTTLDVLILLSPVIEAVASAVGAVPPEMLELIGVLLIANKLIGVTTGLFAGIGPALASLPGIVSGVASAVPAATSGVGALGGGLQAAAAGLSAFSVAAIPVALVAASLFITWQRNAKEAREFKQELDQLTGALKNADGQTRLSTQGLAKYIETQSKLAEPDAVENLSDLGISFSQIAVLAQNSQAGLNDFIGLLAEGGEVTEVWRNEFGEFITASGKVVGAGGDMSTSLGKVIEVNGRLIAGNTGLVSSFEDIQTVTDDVAKAQLDLLVAQKLLTPEQRRYAELANEGAEGTTNWSAALIDAQEVADRQIRVQERAIFVGEKVLAQYGDTATALGTLRDISPDVATSLERVRASGDGADHTFLALVGTLNEAKLSEEDLRLVAVALGTDLEHLQGFVDRVNEALTNFAGTAVTALPTLSDAFSEAGDDGVLFLSEFLNNLEASTSRIATFTENLATITREGFGDIAGVIAEQGPEVAGQLAEQLANAAESGNRELLEQTRVAIDAFNTEWTDAAAFFRDVLGPEFILAAGFVGEAITEEFGGNLDFETQIRLATALAETALDVQGQAIAKVAFLKGDAAAIAYGDALGLDAKTIQAALAAANVLRNDPSLAGAAYDAGVNIGGMLVFGIASGIRSDIEFAKQAAREAVAAAAQAARDEADPGSPSRLFAAIGANMGEGLVAGFVQSAASLATEAQGAVIAAARAAVSSTRLSVASIDPNITAASTGASSGLSFNAVPGMVVVHVTGVDDPVVARQVGTAAASGFLDELARDVEIERRLR